MKMWTFGACGGGGANAPRAPPLVADLEIKMAALGCDDERLDPSTRVLTVLARIYERGCLNQTNQTLP